VLREPFFFQQRPALVHVQIQTNREVRHCLNAAACHMSAQLAVRCCFVQIQTKWLGCRSDSSARPFPPPQLLAGNQLVPPCASRGWHGPVVGFRRSIKLSFGLTLAVDDGQIPALKPSHFCAATTR
jgi:hypothetical protein